MDYINELCPVCQKEFNQGDDIVVCPDCGTPHHRECWLAEGKCARSELHSDDYSWLPTAKTSESEQPISEDTDQKSEINIGALPKFTKEPDEDVLENLCMRGVYAAKDNTFDGVRVGDAALYIQQSAKNYINKFTRGKKFTFNWAALVFGPAWFFYRKMYKVGAIFLTVFVALSLFTMPLAQKAETIANELAPIIEEAESPAAAQAAMMENEELYAKSISFTKTTAVIALVTVLIPNLTAALTANHLYKKKMKKDLAIASEASADQDNRFRKMLIMQKGGVSFFIGGIVFLIKADIAPLLLDAGNFIMNLFK